VVNEVSRKQMGPISKGQVVKNHTNLIFFLQTEKIPARRTNFASSYKLFCSWKNGLCIIMFQTHRDFLYGQLILFSSTFINLNGTEIQKRTRVEQFSTLFKTPDKIYS